MCVEWAVYMYTPVRKRMNALRMVVSASPSCSARSRLVAVDSWKRSSLLSVSHRPVETAAAELKRSPANCRSIDTIHISHTDPEHTQRTTQSQSINLLLHGSSTAGLHSQSNHRRSCLSCCWSKGVEYPTKRCYVGLVAAGVQEQAEDILVPPLLRNCSTLNYISFS